MTPSATAGGIPGFERTLTVEGSVTLDVSIDSGAIRIRRGEAGSVVVRGLVRARSSMFSFTDPEQRAQDIAANPPIVQEGSHVQIGNLLDRGLLRRVDLMLEIVTPFETRVRAYGDSADLSVKDVHGPVQCETDSGEIFISGVEDEANASCDSGAISMERVNGAVMAHTDSGEIRIEDAGSYLAASCDSGSIYLKRVAGSVEAKTDSGEIQALEIGRAIDVKTDSGRIEVSQTAPAPIRAYADSGSITVRLAPEAGYSLRLRTDNGQVDAPQITTAIVTRHEVEGSIRGGGPPVEIEIGRHSRFFHNGELGSSPSFHKTYTSACCRCNRM
jgi:hypothetical protein